MVTGQLSISFLQPVAVDTIVYVEVRECAMATDSTWRRQ